MLDEPPKTLHPARTDIVDRGQHQQQMGTGNGPARDYKDGHRISESVYLCAHQVCGHQKSQVLHVPPHKLS